jgi:hypothetical protein
MPAKSTDFAFRSQGITLGFLIPLGDTPFSPSNGRLQNSLLNLFRYQKVVTTDTEASKSGLGILAAMELEE